MGWGLVGSPGWRQGEVLQRGLYLIEQGNVEGEPEAVLERDLVGQRVAELLGCGGRVCQQGLGGPIHECHRQHNGLLGLGGLKVTKKDLWKSFHFRPAHPVCSPGSLLPMGLEPPQSPGAPASHQGIACPWSQVPREPYCAPHPNRTSMVPEPGHWSWKVGIATRQGLLLSCHLTITRPSEVSMLLPYSI